MLPSHVVIRLYDSNLHTTMSLGNSGNYRCCESLGSRWQVARIREFPMAFEKQEEPKLNTDKYEDLRIASTREWI